MAVAPSLRRAVAELDPALPLGGLKTMDEHLQRSLAKPRFFSTLVTAFGALAVTLALVGIYAMMAWSVSERRQEFAIRLALGARGSVLVRMVLGRALVLAAAGIAAGLAAAWTATGVLAGMLYGIEPTDPSAFALTAFVVAAVALAACYVPARRALHVDPVSLLR
jgi:ABC-type antimicrobial peptide transport system permease subunit